MRIRALGHPWTLEEGYGCRGNIADNLKMHFVLEVLL